MLEDLQTQGLLGLESSKPVATSYQQTAGQLHRETPEAIIGAMYNSGSLQENEQQLLSIVAALPAEYIPLDHLDRLLEGLDIDEAIESLSLMGWLEFTPKKGLKASPVVQAVIRKRHADRMEQDLELLLKGLDHQLRGNEETGMLNCQDDARALTYVHYAQEIFRTFKGAGYPLPLYTEAILNGLAGSIYQITGDLPQASAAFQQSRQVLAKLYEEAPAEAGHAYLLAEVNAKLGDVCFAVGDLPKMNGCYETFLALMKQLHQEYPEHAGYKNILAMAHAKMGQTWFHKGMPKEALEHFEQQAALAKQLTEAYPGQPNFENTLATSYDWLGRIHGALKQLPQALNYFMECSKLLEQLQQRHPNWVMFRNNLAILYSNLGHIHAALGDKPQTLVNFERCAQLNEELHREFPAQVTFKEHLAVSYFWLGAFYHDASAMQPEALDKSRNYLLKAEDLLEALVNDAPEAVAFQVKLTQVRQALGKQ